MDKNRFRKAFEIIKHKHAMYLLWRSRGGFEGTNVPYIRLFCHDLSKIFSTLFLGEAMTKKLHKNKRHHSCLEVGGRPQFYMYVGGGFIADRLTEDFSEAYLDWACARMTKPDKPLDAIQTAERIYPNFAGIAKAYFEKYGYK